jgi:hypothetical protein
MDRSRALLCIALGVAYGHLVIGGCAKGGGGETFGIEDESTSATSGAGTTDDSNHTSGDVSNGAGTTGDSTSGDTSGATTGGNPQTTGDCCVGGTNPGCSNPTISQCVCMQDDYCCTTEWNDECVQEVDSLGCGSCGSSTSGSSTSGGNPSSDCCAPGPAGCGDPAVQQCVCQQDDYCCTTEWNDLCVQEVDQFGCGSCGGSSAASGSSGGNPQGACCVPMPNPGCFDDPTVEQCVCSQDAYCCQTAWDDTCVMEVNTFGCGAC